ncbi:MAG TPA: S-methyl-5'-thioadenosine phosphorylase [Spirochaetota bacterium]|nr:MAG: S-methyl-5'-thioadenosine phosphorylase [Spirochaetes bacterium ADurb.Bin218]HOK03509.1 S-methyl-5'-thioadenosine phosphorylase [Spirochaetota bacterium]HOK93841.1 S-methyl-5'-thioadenosine phosphorylase [Spirochaetota bacterium]HOQ11055.1 S-methyl-5'-thioadenosine phosphorylase [Spirochaetota bacterium]HOV08376.1 S-methyl-5'-thioadenosine phosphorylase [Spirochaetota bacterium]
MKKARIAFIGGSGLYEIEGAKLIEQVDIDTPWGKPSDRIDIVDIEGTVTAFLPRHGRGHKYPPHQLNYRANIAALKMIGVEEIVAFSAVGSLKEEIAPLDFVLPSQIIDRTKARPSTFFEDGIAAHVGFADPFCHRLQDVILPIAKNLGLKMHTGETLICMEGPAFSTRAESNLYRSWGAGVINMSTIPEAKLAREAEMCYAVICMSTDYDCWHESEEDVTVEMVVQNMNTNSANAKKLVKALARELGKERGCQCKEAAKYAVITAPEVRNSETTRKLRAILPDYF